MSTETGSLNKLPEIWGGIECTINRVGDQYRDQLALSGHYNRSGDIEQFATLGISKLRYPVLWEYHQPDQEKEINWDWTAQQLRLIQDSHITPIAGLLHHGSGPVFTSLLDPLFPDKLASFAGKVAHRFPWLEFYTPVNEPLTTARFSGLYGLWYPHYKDEKSFFQMLVNQLKGTVIAMQEIRKVNPAAKLVQTEDLSKIHSTPLLSYQAQFENERRWLTNDLLCGKVDQLHFFWNYLIRLGINIKDLEFFLVNNCPPDIMGINYYVTSERYLDENIQHYPLVSHGFNGTHTYADTEAVREGKQAGLKILLKEAWERYQLPLAITECHLSCTREEQMRWFKQTWDICCQLSEKEIPIESVTAWALLGSYDWNSLLTVNDRYYESGVFDNTHDMIRPTGLHKMIQSLAVRKEYDHPILASRGWWNNTEEDNVQFGNENQRVSSCPILIIGKSGTLGFAFQRICEERSLKYIALGREDIDILEEGSISAILLQYRPWAIINATGYVRVDDAENDAGNCHAVNVTGPMLLARVAAQFDIPFMSFSSDLVFDGDKTTPYLEADTTLPLNVYGQTKAEGERAVLTENKSALVIRTSAFFGPWDRYNFVRSVVTSLKCRQKMEVANDVFISPTYLPDLCHKALDLLIDREGGIWHISNEGSVTWSDFGNLIKDQSGLKQNTLISKPLDQMGWIAARPRYSVLQSNKGILLPTLENALGRFFAHQ